MQTTRTSFWAALLGTIVFAGACSLLQSCEDAKAAPTLLTTKNASMATPQVVDLTSTSCTAGSALTFARSDAVCGVSGVLPAARGGLGVTQPTCTGSQVLTCNGTSCSCTTPTGSISTTGTTLSGDGSAGNPLSVNLGSGNTWTARQTFQVSSGGSKGSINLVPLALGPTSPSDGDMWATTGGLLMAKLNGSTAQVYPQGTTGWPTRKTATDGNSYLYWTMDETALPLANGIVAQGANGNFDVNGSVAFSTFTPLAMFGTGPACTAGTRCGAQASSSTALSPALPISVWYWHRPMATVSTCNPIDGIFKAYRAPGSWTAPFASVILNTTSSCTAQFQVAVGGALKTVSSATAISPYQWNLIYGTYDGVNLCVGVNGFGTTCIAQAGAIDYNGSVGRWGLGVDVDNNASWNGQMDEGHVDTVARTSSYFQTMWTTATGQGGN